jgi:DNA-binding IclR family transcriptional regulator
MARWCTGHEISYVDVIESGQPLRFAVQVGNRRPLDCTAAGKVMLAFLPKACRPDIWRRPSS